MIVFLSVVERRSWIIDEILKWALAQNKSKIITPCFKINFN